MIYNKDRCAIETSVRSLCELTARHGDIGRSHGTTVESMLAGADIHRRLQAEAEGCYNAEIALTNTTLHGGMYYTVSGRADGIIRTERGLVVDEIKCVRGQAFFAPPIEEHLAQLKCYAYFLCNRDGLDTVGARLTYYNTDSEKLKYYNYSYTVRELTEFYLGLLERARFYAEICAYRELEVLPAAARAVFPYVGLREGQEMMIRETFGAIKRGQRLFVQAPTGTGKTMSSLFPAVRALGEGMVDKIFYLTAKASTRREAFSAARRLFSSGVGIRAVVLNSKESTCACQGLCRSGADVGECPRSREYYDRLDGALKELLSSSNGYPMKLIRSVADKYSLCPYELSLDLSEYCDVIICDYNYVFDPAVYLRRYFSDGGKREKYTFLIDEAHNLADRARDMYSAKLELSAFSIVSDMSDETELLLVGAIKAMSDLRTLCKDSVFKDSQGIERGFYMSRDPLERINSELDVFVKKCDGWLKKNTDNVCYQAVYSLRSSVRRYLCVNEFFDKGFLCYVELDGEQITLKTYCLDPSRLMNSLFCRARSSVMFSATLAPTEYFCDVLGCADNSVSVALPSPFDPDGLCVAVADFVSTRFSERESSVSAYVSVIAATVSAKAGNYIVYFPSYDCLEKVHRAFASKYSRVSTVVQKRGMNHSEKEEFLGAFKEDEGKLRIGFCVLGGAFSEGVDLPRSRLIGAIIFGVGLPGLSNERNIIRDYFDEDSGCGYDYAYTYPGMNNVLQAAGRVIRTEDDRGIVVLVDDRYASAAYRRLFPEHWKNIQYAGNSASLAEVARRFWQNKG